jgi:hypothetical protein
MNYEAPIAGSPGQSTTFPQNGTPENREFAAARTGGTSQFPAANEGFPPRRDGVVPNGIGAEIPQVSGAASQTPGNANANADATIKAIHERLKQLGATYYVLEPCGDRMDSFRCFSKVAIGGNPHVTRNFQQIDADPVKAMSTVLQQIEDWRKHG